MEGRKMMNKNLGTELAQFQSQKGKWIAFGVFGCVAAVFLFIAGLVVMLDSIGMGLGLILLGVFVLVVFFKLIGAQKQTVTIFNEGVIIERKKSTHEFHFSEIKGLSDVGSEGIPIIAAGGVAGAIIGGVASAVANNMVDANRRKYNLRAMTIVTNEGKTVPVTNTAGDMLSDIFTSWLIGQKNISPENIAELRIPFGDTLEFKNGELIQQHKRGERRLPVQNITNINIAEASEVHIWGINEAGKEKCIIDLKLHAAYNLDLLYYVIELHEA